MLLQVCSSFVSILIDWKCTVFGSYLGHFFDRYRSLYSSSMKSVSLHSKKFFAKCSYITTDQSLHTKCVSHEFRLFLWFTNLRPYILTWTDNSQAPTFKRTCLRISVIVSCVASVIRISSRATSFMTWRFSDLFFVIKLFLKSSANFYCKFSFSTFFQHYEIGT